MNLFKGKLSLRFHNSTSRPPTCLVWFVATTRRALSTHIAHRVRCMALLYMLTEKAYTL